MWIKAAVLVFYAHDNLTVLKPVVFLALCMAVLQKRHYTTTSKILTQIACVLIVIPLAPFICRFIPPVMVAGRNIDLVIALIIAIFLVWAISHLLRPLIIPLLALLCIVLVYNEFSNKYTFKNLLKDYSATVNTNWMVREHKQTDQVSINPHLFEDIYDRTSREVKEKVQYQDSVVRNFAVKHSLQYFDEYHNKYGDITRFLSLFKYINSNFKYVPDSQRDEYYATPRETILNGLGGDCDDHSILMASCMMSIGAKCRLVIIQGHMYPELFLGTKKEFDVMQQAIIQLFSDERIRGLYYHENNGEYWINLDYTARHPGGPYMDDKVLLIIDP